MTPIARTTNASTTRHHHLRRELAWLLTAKFAALGLLWLMFFSSAHRSPVDAASASRQLAVATSTP
jgi:hypothetical protein